MFSSRPLLSECVSMCVLVCVNGAREIEKRKREGGGGTGVCRDQCMVHTDVSSRQQGCREEKASEWWWRGREKRRRGGRVYDREETAVEWMRQGFLPGEKGIQRRE